MKWFRFYSEAVHDPKLLRLSDEQHRFWVNILCLASNGTPRGALPSVPDIAIILRMKEDKARRLIDTLVAAELLDRDESGAMRPHNWDGRQKSSDDVTERTRKHRHKGRDVDTSKNGTFRERSGNALDTDTDTDRETEQTPYPPDGGTGGGPLDEESPKEDRQTCVILAAELFGDQAGNAVGRSAAKIDAELDHLPMRWDCFAAALRAASRSKGDIGNLVGWCLSAARDYLVTGIPPEPVRVGARGSPANGEPAPRLPEPDPEDVRRAAERFERLKAKRSKASVTT